MSARLVVSSLAVVLLGLAAAAPAAACSCAPGDPRRTLREVDGAFVGVLLSKRLVGGGAEAAFVFRVEQVVKGRLVRGKLPQRFRVYSPPNGAACGLEGSRGARMGLFVERVRGRWVSNLCRQISPAELLRAARPLPRPDGRGSAAVLLGGSFGEARTVALDAAGRTLAYGYGSGVTRSFAVCPGATRVAELASMRDGSRRLAVRTLPRLALVRQLSLGRSGFVPARCSDAAGTRIVGTTSSPDGEPTGIAELRGSTLRPLFTARISGVAIVGGRAYVVEREELLSVDLATGVREPIARVPPLTTELTPSPDGRFLAALVPADPDPDQERPGAAVLVDLVQKTTRTAPLEVVWDAEIAWLDPARVAYLPLYANAGEVAVFDASLTRVGGFRGFQAEAAAVVGAAVWGVAFGGTLTRAELPDGPQRVVRRLPSPEVWAVASALAPQARAADRAVAPGCARAR